jgi:hypothetical protein
MRFKESTLIEIHFVNIQTSNLHQLDYFEKHQITSTNIIYIYQNAKGYISNNYTGT